MRIAEVASETIGGELIRPPCRAPYNFSNADSAFGSVTGALQVKFSQT